MIPAPNQLTALELYQVVDISLAGVALVLAVCAVIVVLGLAHCVALLIELAAMRMERKQREKKLVNDHDDWDIPY